MSQPTQLPAAELDLDSVVPEEERDQVTAWLEAGTVVVLSGGYAPDELGGFVPRVPVGVATDGEITWPVGVEYYVRTYGRGASAALLAHIRSHPELPRLSPERAAAVEELVLGATHEGLRGFA